MQPPFLPNLIQSKPSPIPTQETESLTAKTEKAVDVCHQFLPI